MLTALFRKERAEKVDILDVSRKQSIPGETITESTIQSQLECILSRQGDDSESAPTTTQQTLYQCYLFDGEMPEVAQTIKRDNGERFSVLTKPRKRNGIIVFNAQHIS